jgi:acyl-[acyl carrier protein]--UDP-N-acetylglucosamine O-acyltransferase
MVKEVGKNNIISSTAIIHDDVIIGDNNYIGDNVVIHPNTTIGNNNRIFNGNVIGEFAINASDGWGDYDLSKCKGVTIGDNNIFHIKNIICSGIETKTYVGNNNKILGECHISHDVKIYNNVVFYPRVMTGGFTEYLNNSNIGMCAVIHQRKIIGQYSMIGANNMVTKDVFPYYITINNKINRPNTAKIPSEIVNYDTQLREIHANIKNGLYDIDRFDLSSNIKEELSLFINKIQAR